MSKIKKISFIFLISFMLGFVGSIGFCYIIAAGYQAIKIVYNEIYG